MLFYTARIALLKGNFTFVSISNQLQPFLDLLQNKQADHSLLSAGPGEVPGVYRRSAGVAPDPPPVLLGADVGLLVRAELEGGVSVR